MPIYTIPGRQKPILVQGDQMDQFWEKHPDAKLQAEAGGQKYSVSKDEFGYFKEDFPDYKSEIANTYYNSSNQTQAKPVETQEEQANEDKPGFLGSMANRFAAGASEAFGSAANLVNKIAGSYNDAVNYSNGLSTNTYKDNPLAQVGKEAKETAEGYRQAGDLYNGKGFTELFKEGHPLDAAGSAFLSATESLPQSLAIAMGGKLGLLAAFGTTASDKYDQLKEEYPEMPEWKAMSNALWTGASEALTEVFGAGTIGRTVKGLLAKGGKKEAADLVKKSFLDKLAKAEENHWLIMPALSEFSEESANALSEWAVDKMTGVQRDDNILLTMIDAGTAGAMGGVQFSPVIGAAKFQNNRIKNKVTKEFKQASDQVSGFLPDDQKAILIDGLHQYQVNNDLDNAQKFVDEFAQNMGASQEQYKMIVDLARASVGYNNYVDYVNDQIDQETKKRIDEINSLRNPEMGSIVQAKMGEMDDPVYIVGGTLAYKDDMSIDVDNSSDIIYFVDANGKTQQATPQSFSALVNDFPLEQAYNEAYNLAKTDIIQREEAGDASQFAPGQQVMTSNGVAGQVQSIDEDGNVIVNSNGITNVYKPEDLQVMQEQAQPTMQPDVQQEQAPAFPMDKDGNIDFGQISDPQQFADGLKQEFGDGGTAIIDQYIANEQAKLAKTSKAGDPIKSARDKASAQAKLDFYNQVKGAMGTEMGLTGDKNPINPIPQGEEYQSVAEFNANNGISDNPIIPQNQTENPIEQGAARGDIQSVDNGIVNTSENPTNPIEQEPAKQPTTDDVVADILDGELDDQEVDDYVAENKRAAQNSLTVINNKKPKMSTNKAEYLAKRAAWQQEADAAQAEVDRWNEIGAKIAETRKGIGADEAARILSQTEPMNGHELAAKMLADGSIKLTHDSFKKETGGGTGEARGFFGLFARPEKGGVNIERAGEMLMLADLEAGTNFFDQNDPNAGRNAIIDVLSEARTRRDLINYIRNNREEQARREQEAQYNAYAQQIMDEYHMSPDEYEAYERLSEEAAKMMTPEQQAEIDGEIYDQIMQEQADEAERMAIFDSLNNNNENGTTETEGDPGTAGGVQEESNGGNEVLPGQQVSDPGRGEVLDKQGNEPVSDNAGQDGVSPKSEAERIKDAEKEVDQNPTDAQKEAGNYKKGHVSIKGFDISIENPAGSIRSGVNADGKRWENKMNNTYGYFKGTQSVDGDHIDVYLSNDMDSWSGENVYVIDQYNPDGSFDEHKVMFGFDNADEALNNFLANYEKGWGDTRRLDVTPVSMDGFKKWIDSSHRKTKPFSKYTFLKSITEDIDQRPTNVNEDGLLVDGEGNALTLYHGTPNDVDLISLDMGHKRDGEDEVARFNGNGIYFTPDKIVANEYATSGGSEGKIFEVNVTLKKPYFTVGSANFTSEEAAAFTEELIAKGYDGIINYSNKWMRDEGALPTEVIVFDINAVKPISDTRDKKDSRTIKSIEIISGISEHDKTTIGHIKALLEGGYPEAKIGRSFYRILEKKDDGTVRILHTVESKRNGVLVRDEKGKLVEAKERNVYDIAVKPIYENETSDNLPNQQDAFTEKQDPRYREGRDGDYAKWKERRDYLDELERKDLEARKEGREDYYIEREDGWGQRNGTFDKVWLKPEDVNSEEGQLLHLRGYLRNVIGGSPRRVFLSTRNEAYHSGSGFSLGNTYYSADELASKWRLKPVNDASNDANNTGEIPDESAESSNVEYRITPYVYTTKRGKKLNMHLVTFSEPLSREQMNAAKKLAKDAKGWWSKNDNGFLMRDMDSAKKLAEEVLGNEEAVEDAQPVTLAETRRAAQTETDKTETAKPNEGFLVSDDRYAELRERMRKKLGGQLYVGIDPEILAIGTEMAVYHLERGARKFTEYAKAMIADLGDVISPYLKAFYNGARDLPEVENSGIASEMTPYEEVRQFDVSSLNNGYNDILTTVKTLADEQTHQEEAEQAKQEIINQRNTERRKEDEQTSADTEAISSQAEAVASEAEGIIEEATSEAEIDNAEQRIDEQLNAVDDQLSRLIDEAHSGMRVILKDGRNVLLSMVMHSGEQVSATQFSKPRVDRMYGIYKGEMITISPEDVDIEATSRLLEDNNKKMPAGDEIKEKKAKKSKKKEVALQNAGKDLFEDVETNEKQTEDGLQAVNESSTGGLQTDSVQSEQRLRDVESEAGKRTGETSRRSDASREGRSTVQDRDRSESRLLNQRNNRSERGVNYAPKSVDARIDANIKAIELANELFDNGETATAEQMAVLRRFSGWGGLGRAFDVNGPYAAKIRELIGDEAYEQATLSRKSSFYTPANVIDTLWDIAKNLGFNGGMVLEGSAGIGNIIGSMPAEISNNSHIQAVEYDQTTGKILSLLYPDAQVDIKGFEETKIKNGSVDLAITNVPFSADLRVKDTTGDGDLSKKFHDIHDFCIAKNVRKLREGGIGIFITSNGTLDNSQKLRNWVINDGGSDFIGAFRMNNKTFGGTGTTSDIIVIRKRVNGEKSNNAIDVADTTVERVVDYDTGETKKVKGKEERVIKRVSMDYNKYFVEHPENMAGVMRFGFEENDTYRPFSKNLYPSSDKNQNSMLAGFAESFDWKGYEASQSEVQDENVYEKLGEDVKEGSMVLDKSGNLCVAYGGNAVPLNVNSNKVKGHTKEECFLAYSRVKRALSDVMDYQVNNEGDKGLPALLDKLNKEFDSFVSTYGHLHKNTAISFLRNDVDFQDFLALETYKEENDEKGNRKPVYTKTDVFKGRVIEKDKNQTFDNVKDGIIASIYKYGRVDVPFIANTLSRGEEDVKSEIVKSGIGFEDPISRQMEVSYEYLSGNVREKLKQAIAENTDGRYDANIKALQAKIPMDIPAHLIEFSIGSSWIDPKMYADYIKEMTDVAVVPTSAGGTWVFKNGYNTSNEKNKAMGVRSGMFNKVVLGHELIEAAMQDKSITISETRRNWDGTAETVTDKEATQACSNKIDEIRQHFKDWARAKIQNDPEMSERIEKSYNEQFNNYVPKSVPDEFIPKYFPGATHSLQMRPHQSRAIIRGTTQPLLLAHEVGTGKTFTMISIAMEMRRLGTAKKPMIVVQNATTGQFVESAKKLYPNAKVLSMTDNDYTAEGRKLFHAKIKYNDWDMIVIPQSVFERIPDSEERRIAFVKDKIQEKMITLERLQEADDDNNFLSRTMEREIEQLNSELVSIGEEINEKKRKKDEKKEAQAKQNARVKAMDMLDRAVDDVENFDDMGIDAILVDEAHEYKHLGFSTVMQRGVKGVDPSYSKKAQGVYLKTQAVLEKNNGKNVIFATGTPISNTAAEIWTFMRYLMPADRMKEYGIYYFDDFVRNFGSLQQMLEFTTTGFKENNRFAGYVNLPELVRIWSSVSDTVLTEEAEGVKDKIPELEGGKATDVYLPQTKSLRGIMLFVKDELEKYDKMSGKEKRANSHIPLTMYGIAKAAAVDARLVSEDATDDPNSKTNESVRQTLRSLKDSEAYRGTVALFADNYQNKKSGFNLYEEIRDKLIKAGVPAEKIVIMRAGMTTKKKLEIFEKVNSGEIRVIMGSTFTLGTGVNIQERLHTLIHIDAPNRPMDYTQRNGRILRQGNIHKKMGIPVRVLRFGVEDSLDVTAYQRLKTKGAIAESIMKGKEMMKNSMESRVLEEDEDVFGDTVAQLSGSEYAMLKNQAEKELRKLTSKKKQWEADQTYVHNAIPRIKGQIREAELRAEVNKKRLELIKGNDGKIVANGKTYNSLDDMADFFKQEGKKLKEDETNLRNKGTTESVTRNITLNIGGLDFNFKTTLKGEYKYENGRPRFVVSRKAEYSCPDLYIENITCEGGYVKNGVKDILDEVINGKIIKEWKEYAENSAKRYREELSTVQAREGKPFQFENELLEAEQRLNEYTRLMRKELAEKEAKYAKMDSEVEEASNVSVAEEDDGLLYRAYDEGAETANDIMSEAGQSFAESLGVADQVEFVTDKAELQGKRASAKGFFDRKTGKVTVVVPNHTSVGDMQATILHELVGHYGLRKLFGDKFDDMMDRTFKAMPKELRRAIAEEAISKYRGDIRTATEEYLASIAERGVRDMKLWEKIKAGIKDFFRSIGINLTMRDEDIAYMLWRSKNRLKASDTMLEVALKIADNADMQSLLYRDGMGFGSMLNTPKVDRNGVVEISEWLKERLKNRSAQRELYLKVREGYQDNMIRVREWQREVERETGHKVQDHEDFYTFKNQTSSRAQYDMQKFQAECGQAIWDEIDKLAQKIGKPAGEGTRMIENYEMVKHGLERNEYMRQQAIDQLQYQATIDIDNAKAKLKGKQLQDAIDKITAKLNNEVAKYENKDYSGLTALSNEILGSDKMDEAALSKWVDDFEKQYDTMPLWKAIREATNRTLQQQLRTGLISKETYDKISGMYKFYIPLKDWDGTRAQDLYEYENGDRDIIQNPLKHAKGRTTRAGNVLANIASAYESATILGYKNLANQRLLNLVRNSGTQSAVASEQWFIKSYDAQGNEYWQPAYASGFNEDPDHNAKVIADFEADMKQKQEQGLAKTVHEVAKLGVPVKAWQEQQHIVKVKEGGVDKTVYFLGDPRVSQAVNGLNNRNYDMWLIRQANNVRKFMMLNYTSRNVTFILRNLLRDISYVPTMSYVKYGWDFTQKYVKWLPKAMKDLAKAEYGGKSDPEVENFYKNGGATGYLDSIGYERYKKEIDSLIKASEGKDRLKYLKKIFAAVGMHVERVNNIVENANRYAVYRAAKESGFSELKAIEAAKEASVNFNRRGSGQYGGAIAQNAYFFFNAAIQGTQNFGSAVANNKVRALKALGFWFALGVMFRSLSGLFGDDDDEYNQLPDYVRQNNLVIPLWKGQYLSIPLSIEIRAVYGLGDMIAQAFQGGYDDNKMGFVSDALLKLMDLAPISIEIPQGRRTSEEMAQSIMKNFVPDAAKPVYDVIFTNENFYGKRITGRNEYNIYIPEWQKASFGTSKALIEASKKLNEATGGDYATKGWADGLLTNPAVAEYLFEQYLGGVGKAFGQAYKTVEAAATGDKVYSRNIPIVSGLTYSTENMVPKDNTSKRYSNYIDDFNEAQSRYKQYQKGVANGEATSEQFTNFVNSPGFMRYQIIGAYKKQVDGINDMRKALDPDDPMNETLAKYALETKRQMIERLKEMEE